MRRHLESEGFPRLQMILIVSITGGAGFLASFVLLHAGLIEMWLRYLSAFGVAYVVFLILLWLWLRTSASDYADLGDLANLVPSPSPSNASSLPRVPQPIFSGKGGTADGGGASGNFELADSDALSMPDEVTDSAGKVFSAAADADEFAVPLIVLVLLGALLLSSFWIVYSAPVLFAELMVDGVLAASLYRRLRGVQADHWMLTAVRRTLWPFMLTALLFAASGWWMQETVPEARSIGDVMRHHAQTR